MANALSLAPYPGHHRPTTLRISRYPHPVALHREQIPALRTSRRIQRLCATPDKAPQVICIGDALFDMLADDFDVPRAQVKSWTPKAGGANCNVASGLAKFGVNVAFISAVGRDELGDRLIEILKDVGVNVEDVKRRPEPTRDVYVTRKSSGEREFVGFGREAYEYADCHIDPLDLPIDKIKTSSVLVCGTLGQAFEETGEATRLAVSIAREAGVCVFIDVNWRPVFFQDPVFVVDDLRDFVKQADLVKMTKDEAGWMFGIDPALAMLEPCQVRPSTSDRRRPIDRQVLAELPTARGVLVTAGEDGAAYCLKSKSGLHSGFFPAFAVSVVDTTGAGDAFTSGFVYQSLKHGGLDGLLESPDAIDDAIEFASASGGITATGPGAIEAQPPSPAIVEQLIATLNV